MSIHRLHSVYFRNYYLNSQTFILITLNINTFWYDIFLKLLLLEWF